MRPRPPANIYTWDARNRLVSANNNGATFDYDPLGRRSGKTILSANTNFLYDGVNPVQELNGTTVSANLLTGGIDEYFTRTDASGSSNYLTDALSSTVALTNSAGNSTVQYSYGPFGNTSITGTTTNTFTYTGREIDGLGINYYRARYYNPQTGRFISEDPVGFLGGINAYAYVDDSPTNFIDPFGLDKKDPNKSMSDRARCAAANAASLQSLLGLQNSTLADVFLSNDVSQLTQLALGPGRAEAALQTITDSPLPYNLVDNTAAVVAQVPTGKLLKVSTEVPGTGGVVLTRTVEQTVGMKVAGTVAGKLLSKGLVLWSISKGVFDVGAYAYAYYQCE